MPDKRARIETSRAGTPTLVIDGRYVHSRHDPGREAERAMYDIVRREPPTLVLLGLGLGYHVRYVLDHTELTKVLVFEPDPRVIELAERSGIVELDLDEPRLRLIGNLGELADELPVSAVSGFEVFRIPGRPDVEALDGAETVIRSFTDRLEINRNTLKRFGRLWVRNLCRNLDVLTRARALSGLTGRFAGYPAIILAAGPTLDQILPNLREIAERCLVVAVDTAVSPALAAGVEPDFAVVVDPQYWNARHLDRVRSGRSILVSEPSTFPSVFRAFSAPIYLCSSVFPLGRSLESVLGRFGSLGAGGSVSTSAWDLARLLGSDAVYVAGLDLGFPHGRTHYRSSFFEHLALILGARQAPAEGTIFRYVWGATPRDIPANDGTALLSDRRMDVYRNWFGSQVVAPGAPRTSAITSGGAQIEGIERADVAELLSLRERRAEIDAILDAIRTPARLETSRAAALVAHVEDLATSLGELGELARRAEATLAAIAHERSDDRSPDLGPLAPLDEAIGSHPAAAIGSFLMQDAIERIRSGYGSASIEEQLAASEELYTQLASASEYHSTLLRDAVTRIQR